MSSSCCPGHRRRRLPAVVLLLAGLSAIKDTVDDHFVPSKMIANEGQGHSRRRRLRLSIASLRGQTPVAAAHHWYNYATCQNRHRQLSAIPNFIYPHLSWVVSDMYHFKVKQIGPRSDIAWEVLHGASDVVVRTVFVGCYGGLLSFLPFIYHISMPFDGGYPC